MSRAKHIWTGIGLSFLIGSAAWWFLRGGEDSPKVPESEALTSSSPAASPQPIQERPRGAAHPEADWREQEQDFPQSAISGEYVLHFEDAASYAAYLQALTEQGLAPLNRIDSLRVIRIGASVAGRLDPRDYGAELGFSYRIAQPPAPVEIAPEALARLQSFSRSAREIAGGALDGSGAGVLIAVLDSGLAEQAYFEGVRVQSLDLTGKGVLKSGAEHGTAVASILVGPEGLAPEADLLMIRVLDEDGLGNSFHLAEGIVAAVDQGARVINMSLGVYEDTRVVREAVRYARQRGVVLVAAAGNDALPVLPYPAAYEEVLAVSAVDAGGRQALFPNQSNQIDLAAPGVGVLTAAPEVGTKLFSGTSAAAPFVSGTVAALLSEDSNRTGPQAVELIQSYLNEAGAPGPDPLYGRGVLDWDRLRQRGEAGLVDLALASIHLDAEALPGTTMPVEISVQNRGTSWQSNARLEVIVGNREPVHFVLESLAPGQVASRKLYTAIPSKDAESGLDIVARVVAERPMDEIQLENNLRAVRFRPRTLE